MDPTCRSGLRSWEASNMKNYLSRTISLVFGLFLFALGLYLNIQANIGLAPWEAFSMGVANLTHLSYGNVVVLTGIVILLLDIALKEKVGFGTIFNVLLIGKFADLIASWGVIPKMTTFLPGLVMLLVGQVSVCVGSYFYIGAALGCGPRDALMVALGKRMKKTPIGVIRGLIEGTVLVIGWLLGAKVGIGTAISVLGIGFILQWTFRLLRFDVKNVAHENILETVRQIGLIVKVSRTGA